MSAIDSFDWTILHWLNAYAVQVPVLDRAVEHVMYLKSLQFGLMISALWWFWFEPRSSNAECRSRIIMIVLASLVGLFVGRLLAEALPFRIRPYAMPGHELRPLTYVSPGLRTWSSFPSDHAVMAFAFATGLWMIHRGIGALAFLLATFSICLPRLYLGLHYPSDLVAGGLIGIAITWMLNARAIRAPVAGSVLKLERCYPSAFYAGFFLLSYEITQMFDDIRHPVAVAFRLLHGH